MAKVGFVDTNLIDIDKYEEVLRAGNRFTFSRSVQNKTFLSPERKAQIASRSYFSVISEYWRALSSAQKQAWEDVDPRAVKNGWQMFIKDQAARIKLGLSGVATPSALHQDYVGIIHLEPLAGEFKLVQAHPSTYQEYVKVVGKKSMYQSVEIKEPFYLPFELKISYKTDMSVNGGDPMSYFGARIISHYQGRDIETLVQIPISLSSSWTRETQVLTSVLGVARYYTLEFYFKDVEGDCYFDNIEANHSGQNWARDPFCEDVEKTFPRSFQEISPYWIAEIDNEYCVYGSGYLDET